MRRLMALCFLTALISCSTGEVRETGEQKESISGGDLVKLVTAFNSKAPSTIEGEFYIDGVLNKKKYKTMGNAVFNREPVKMNITITDLIFKSTLTMVIQDDKELGIYTPVENKLYKDSVNSIRLDNYVGVDFNYSVLYDIFTGSIPLLKGYRVKKAVVDKGKHTDFLIVENDDYFETISFVDKIPDKLLFINKANKLKIEFYLQKLAVAGDTRYFKSVKIVCQERGINLTLYYNTVKLNSQVKVKSLEDMKLPKNVNIIKM